MFEANKARKALVKAALARMEGLQRGDVVPHADLETAWGIGRYTPGWNYLVKMTKRAMLKLRRITLWPEQRVGYKLCTVEEQATLVLFKRQQRAARQLRAGILDGEAVQPEITSDHQRAVNAKSLHAMSQARRYIVRAVRAVRAQAALSRKDETMPRPQPMATAT